MAPSIIYRMLAFVVSYLPAQIRAKLWQRLMVIGERRWPRQSASQRIPGGMFVKQGFLGGLVEGQAMRFVAAHTSIPVPVVVDNLVHGETSYLVMSRLPGDPLEEYLSDISPETEQHLSAQISRMLAPMRALPPPSGAVCAFDGGPVNGWCMTHGPPLGPWESVEAFHKALMWRTCGMTYIPEGVDSERVHDVIRTTHGREHRICLTHCDFAP